MALRDKTNQRFKEFFEKQSKRNEGKEFEIAFSEIQRATGAASSTMKRALEALSAEGWLEINPGRNSRYGIFKLMQSDAKSEDISTPISQLSSAPDYESAPEPAPAQEPDFPTTSTMDSDEGEFKEKIYELEHLMDGLRRRIRTQEMTIALLQDRLAEIEDKLYRR
ncbi:IclR family transcriptional regulator [Desulfitobacterium sp. THU1]|uniref:IclR family transcriptional regulator n=1 Tax=Desulfitobacterium sp. THU1 TaxID=3138072 RepID=UPI00311D6367